MRRLVVLCLCACSPSLPPPQFATSLPGEAHASTEPATVHGLGQGADAPDFALEDSDGRIRGLNELHLGGPLLVYFYPGSYAENARGQLARLQARAGELPRGSNIVGISPDTKSVRQKLHDELKLTFPLLGDPELRAARAYHVADAGGGIPLPTLFVVDKAGKVRWSLVQTPGRLIEDAAIDAMKQALE